MKLARELWVVTESPVATSGSQMDEMQVPLEQLSGGEDATL